MSTFQVHASVIPPPGGFARVVSFFKTRAEIFLDAQREAAAAHKRYPFAIW
jgi:hypothetical protein